jgi:hypothetical protein
MGARFSIDAALQARALSDVPKPPREQHPAISLAVPCILLQVALLYTFNVLHKSGPTWHEGTAVHYALQQDRIVTWLGWKLRPHMTLSLSRALSYAAIVVESLLPVLLLTPLATKPARRIALLLAVGLHAGFALLLNLGMFSLNMPGFFLLFLSDRDWQSIAAWRAGRLHALISHATRRGRAVLLGWLPAPASPATAIFAATVREGLVVLFAIALGSQAMLENQALPDWLRVQHQPLALRVLVEYPRLMEGWSMFAPDAPQGDMFLYVDALTEDGRHVDPVNELASRVSAVPVDTIPEYLDQDDSWCDYTTNLVGRPEYFGTLRDFILAYPKRTHRSRDRIRSFKVWVLEDESPRPGETVPRNTTRRVLFEG